MQLADRAIVAASFSLVHALLDLERLEIDDYFLLDILNTFSR